MELPSAVTGAIDGAIEFIYSFGPLVEHTVVLGKSIDFYRTRSRSSADIEIIGWLHFGGYFLRLQW